MSMRALAVYEIEQVGGGPAFFIPLGGAIAGGAAVAASDAFNGRGFDAGRVATGAGLGAMATLGPMGFGLAFVGTTVLL